MNWNWIEFNLVGIPVGKIGVGLVILLITFAVQLIVETAASRWLRYRGWLPGGVVLNQHFRPTVFLTILSRMAHLVLPVFDLRERWFHICTGALEIIFIVSATWFSIKLVDLVKRIIFAVYDVNIADNIKQRRIRTQMQFVVRLITIAIAVVGFSAVLLTFDGARKLGASLLASAGIASVVIGFAAQRSLGNLIAGFQIAFTQPLRIDDVVIVENEWGRVEEITLTYVSVKLWDLRRLIVPITYFVEKPFQNWTRISSDILGHTMIHVDYQAPVDILRNELKRIATSSALWDGRVCVLQVTDCKERSMQLRCLLSARNASDSFDLGCIVREEMIQFVQDHYPQCLPKLRADVLTETGRVTA